MTFASGNFINLVSRVVDKTSTANVSFEGEDGISLYKLAHIQGVAAIACDGLQKVYDSCPDVALELDKPELLPLKRKWFGLCMNVEKKYDSYVEAIGRLAKFYQSQGIEMMLLKGYGLSLNYPVPSHRQPGDIDIYLWDKWEEADRLVSEKLGIKVDNSHHHHSVFKFDGFMVENHYDFVNVHSHRSHKAIEETFKKLAADRSAAVEHILPNGVKIYFPSPDLNALFVIRHMACHFAAEAMNLRQLLDWALFVDKHHKKVDWRMFWSESKKMGMEKFVLCVNAIAVERLGFDAAIFNTPEEYRCFAEHNRELVDKVLEDILEPKTFDAKGKSAISYIWIRFKCWFHNRWKHKLVYTDNLLSTFFAQLLSHLMKPATIIGK